MGEEVEGLLFTTDGEDDGKIGLGVGSEDFGRIDSFLNDEGDALGINDAAKLIWTEVYEAVLLI